MAPQHMVATPRRPRQRSSSFLSIFFGFLADIMITLAVILFLYIFWQLVWTTWKVDAPRTQRVESFHDENSQIVADSWVNRTDDPPAFGDQPAQGEVYGIMYIPKWDWMELPVSEGTSTAVLDRGDAGHYNIYEQPNISTAQPGEIGNFSVAAHRQSYGNGFRRIMELGEGDKVIVETRENYYVYAFSSNEIVTPSSSEVIAPVPGDKTFSLDPTDRMLTMTTCHPEWGNSERFIVHMKFESWAPKSEGMPIELKDKPAK